MGYTLKIGDAEINLDFEYGFVDVDVKLENHVNAPAFGEPTDNLNERWPSYTSWNDAMEYFGLKDMFFNKEFGLLRDHPGEVPLTKKHKYLIDKAYKDFKIKYPNAVAGYSPKINFEKGIYEDNQWPIENNYLTRLEWLKYWVDWSLKNCEKPIFKNT